MSRTIQRAFVALLLVLGVIGVGRADDTPYTEGSVLDMTYVRIKPGGFDQYMKFLSTDWKAMNEALKKEGLILSYRIVSSTSANRDDWDLMLVVEYKNMAALDGLDEKSRGVIEKLAGSMAKADEKATQRGEVREIIGEKLGRELTLK
ncbi:MAG: hypothetical protein U0610_18485 [bacterium]